MLPKPVSVLLGFRTELFDKLPEVCAVVGVLQMTQLMDDDVLLGIDGCHHQQGVEGDQSLAVAAAPTAFVRADFQAARLQTDDVGPMVQQLCPA